MKAKPFTSFKAWASTLPLALGLPVVVWMLLWGIYEAREVSQLSWSEIKGQMIFLGIATLIHLLAYLITGLPIFLSQFGKGYSPIWMPTFAVPLGAILGALMIFALLIAFGGAAAVHPEQWTFYLIGAGYGTATAIGAVLQSPNRN